MSETVVIASATRTPMGAFQGELRAFSAPDLGAIAIEAALERAGISPVCLDEVIMGCVLSAALKQGPARQAALKGGLPKSCGATTINKICGSGMKAIMFAHDMIRAGSCSAVVAGGMESMSGAPYLLVKGRSGYRMGHAKTFDHMFLDGLEDAETGRLMGAFAQEIADKAQISREAMDAYAIQSLKRARVAIEKQKVRAEITPVTLKDKKNTQIIQDDEQPFRADLEKIPKLRPAFSENGTITAANASSISDGASALVLLSEGKAKALGIKPLAKILGHASHAQHPAEFCLAPIGALTHLFEKTGLGKDAFDLYEINEAFAVVAMLAIEKLKLDPERVNIYGGACAQGHPLGSTGSRLVVTLLNALRQEGGKRGCATLCIGGGEATAIAIELI